MRQYKTVIFDLDDTLFDFKDTEAQALRSLFSKYGIDYGKETLETYQEINQDLWSRLERGQVTKDQVLFGRFESFFKTYGYDLDPQEVELTYRSFLNRGHKVLPNSRELLDILRTEGYRLLAGTNGVAATQKARLKASRLGDYFEGVFISEEIGHEKPSREFFQAIFRAYPDLKKQETIMVGDSPSSDIQGARNFQIDSILVDPKDRVKNSEATYRVTDLLEIPKILERPGLK